MSLLLIRPTDVSHSQIRASFSLPSETYKEIHFHKRLISQIHSESERQEPTNTLMLFHSHACTHTRSFSLCLSHAHTTSPYFHSLLQGCEVPSELLPLRFSMFPVPQCLIFLMSSGTPQVEIVVKSHTRKRREIWGRKKIKVCSLFFCLWTGFAAYQVQDVLYMQNMIDYLRVEIYFNNH